MTRSIVTIKLARLHLDELGHVLVLHDKDLVLCFMGQDSQSSLLEGFALRRSITFQGAVHDRKTVKLLIVVLKGSNQVFDSAC